MWILLLLELTGFSFCDVLDYYSFKEGDIIQTKSIFDTVSSASASPDLKWPNATVPYEISHEYTDLEKQELREAMDEIENKTCVRFREARESDGDVIGIVKEKACASFLGRQGSIQDVSLDNNNRGLYYQILWSPSEGNTANNVGKTKSEDLTLMSTPYSNNSVQHQTSNLFHGYRGYATVPAKNGPDNTGGREQLDDIDVKKIQNLYCSDRSFPLPRASIPSFNFQPRNGEIMWSKDCSFYGNDIEQKRMEAKSCIDYCARNPKCSHFTWNPLNDGICYLKAGFVPNTKLRNAEWDFFCGYKGSDDSESFWEQGEQGIWRYISSDFKWPQVAQMPYQIFHNYTDSERKQIREAMDEIEGRTCIRFPEVRAPDRKKIRIVKGNGCYYHIDDQNKIHNVSLDEGCLTSKEILRQLMHSLGFGYEHNRTDRDEYVEIVWNNITKGQEHNFEKRKNENLKVINTSYSYDSIMHLSSDAFAKVEGATTIVAKKPTDTMGEGDHLSDIDVTRIQNTYCFY